MRHHRPMYTSAYGDEYSTDPMQPLDSAGSSSMCSKDTIITGAVLAIPLVLTALLLYALAASSGDTVRSACPMLWEVMLVRCMSSVVFLAVLACLLMFAPSSASADDGDDQYSSSNTLMSQMQEGFWTMTEMNHALIFLYAASFGTMEAVVLANTAGSSQTCTDALELSGVGGSPFLADLGWVYAAMDICAAIFVVLRVGYGLTVGERRGVSESDMTR